MTRRKEEEMLILICRLLNIVNEEETNDSGYYSVDRKVLKEKLEFWRKNLFNTLNNDLTS